MGLARIEGIRAEIDALQARMEALYLERSLICASLRRRDVPWKTLAEAAGCTIPAMIQQFNRLNKAPA